MNKWGKNLFKIKNKSAKIDSNNLDEYVFRKQMQQRSRQPAQIIVHACPPHTQTRSGNLYLPPAQEMTLIQPSSSHMMSSEQSSPLITNSYTDRAKITG